MTDAPQPMARVSAALAAHLARALFERIAAAVTALLLLPRGGGRGDRAAAATALIAHGGGRLVHAANGHELTRVANHLSRVPGHKKNTQFH